jgi:hypothetical protein
VTLAILDSTGTIVRTLKGPANAGLNRVWWNLRFDPTREARLRTSPRYAPWFTVGLEGKRAPGLGRYAVLAPPGSYTVRLTALGKQQSQQLVLRKDPSSGGAEHEIRLQMELVRSVVRDLDDAVQMLNTLEAVRGQLVALKAVFQTDSTHVDSSRADVRAAADSLDRKLVTAEERLYQVRVTGRGQDALRWPVRLAEQLEYLAQSVGGSDYAPTQSEREVQQLLHGELQAAHAQVDQLLQHDVAAFNDMLRRKNLQNIIATMQ